MENILHDFNEKVISLVAKCLKTLNLKVNSSERLTGI